MSGTGRCYDNARMESFFTTLKKEKLYKMNTAKMTTADVKSVISDTFTTTTGGGSTPLTGDILRPCSERYFMPGSERRSCAATTTLLGLRDNF
jgi:transposase InsO family protein